MKPLTQTLRSTWFVVSVHTGFWLIFFLAVTGLGGKGPGFREITTARTSLQSLVPAAPLDRLFSRDLWPKALVDTNALNPFSTRYFIPTTAPAAPPPTTRKIELTYLGFFQTADQPKRTMVKLGDNILVTQVGSNLTANLYAAEASIMTLTLTNPTAQTNLLPLNTKKEIEVPMQ